MRDPIRFVSLTILGTLISAGSNLLPNFVFDVRMPSHTVPLAQVSSPASQQALAYSHGSPLVLQNSFEMEYVQAWELLDRYFLYRDRLVNWSSWKYRYHGNLNSVEEADNAIDEMVSSLSDEYTFYRNGKETAVHTEEEKRHNVVTTKRLPGGVGYIHLATFSSCHCVDEMRSALKKFQSSRALILDLRHNSGGSIANALQIFAMLCAKGEFVRTEGIADSKPELETVQVEETNVIFDDNGTKRVVYREPYLAGEKPLTVIVDGTTRSAAEMLTGALRDNNRAIVIGSKTFGKGIIQRIWQFEQGTSIKITAARYFLPGGTNIHNVGLRPNIIVPAKGHTDVQLNAALHHMAART